MTAPQDAITEPRAAVSREIRLCAWCKAPFQPYRSWDKYCRGGACKRAAEDAASRIGQLALGLIPTEATLVRKADLPTSHGAASEHVESGTHESDCALALRLVSWHPGLTSWELARIAAERLPQWWGTNVDHVYHVLARRLPNLRDRWGEVSNRRDLDKSRQLKEPDEHVPAGKKLPAAEWWPVAATKAKEGQAA